ncbi:MAG TPA: cysteine--tRNA ligase [Paenalcaligenes sp.]|nr:cysteine--tRNA ligase [Paenalcaligenes sp.]HLR82462.1 cysteine--tRNA ligase [Paenalcaligenes sp.]
MLHIYNSLSRKKEVFRPVEPGQVRMYVCGMTVYDFCHLGHARMLVSFDVIQRWLRASGYQVQYVRNITDIDDKIINKAIDTGQSVSDITDFYTQAMHADEKALNVQSPDFEPRATEHVPAMLDIIERLKEKDLAYQGTDGDVHYAVRKFADYGKLSGRTLDELRAGERVAVADGKRDPLDFVLWKAAKDGEPDDCKWPSAYGVGRPGWHIECSAMSYELLGMPLDIHGGGPDLKFPHHENEIAQSEGAFDGQMANYWMHCGPLMVDADKMSKSLGNFKRIRDTIAVAGSADLDSQAEYDANLRESEMLRFFIVRNHYRSIQNFAPDNLNDAQQAIDRLYHCLANVPPAPGVDTIDWSHPQAAQFKEHMDDDFNTAGAISVLFELANHINREKDAHSSALLKNLGALLGVLQHDPQVYLRSASRYRSSDKQSAAAALSETEIEAQIAARTQAKNDRDFEKADAIRDHLRAQGIELEDKAGGETQWRRM